ncbi:hypothetical protein ACFZCK_04585 [Kitasatospora purpeofusca]|uniref:hypothetical protein n=1 Tax=Kitasatospora purpeofusca TaxID=67352 RepID=UPI0036E3B9DD
MAGQQQPPADAVAKDPHWTRKMERLRARRLAERPVVFCDDDDAKARVTAATIELVTARAAARTAADDQHVPDDDRDQWVEEHALVAVAKSALAAATAELEAVTIRLVFRALPRPVWRALLEAHAPSEEQAGLGMEYDVDSFPAALVSACHVERDEHGVEVDGMSVEDAQSLLDEWSEADARLLFTAALTVNQTLRGDLGKG